MAYQRFKSQETPATVAKPLSKSGDPASEALSAEIALDLERAKARLKAAEMPSDGAIEIVKADWRNDLRLYEPQTGTGLCHLCGGREDVEHPFVPVLTATRNACHWLHRACLDEHSRRIGERVEAILALTTHF